MKLLKVIGTRVLATLELKVAPLVSILESPIGKCSPLSQPQQCTDAQMPLLEKWCVSPGPSRLGTSSWGESAYSDNMLNLPSEKT